MLLGHISGIFGVQGWVRIYSHTQPREQILQYSPWLIGREGRWQDMAVLEGRRHGRGVVARLDGCEDREAARALMGAQIAVYRDQLQPLAPGEYYWVDLEGLQVVTREGVPLGRVVRLFETGAHDVLVVRDPAGEREWLIPFVQGRTVTAVDLAAGYLEVDWAPDWLMQDRRPVRSTEKPGQEEGDGES